MIQEVFAEGRSAVHRLDPRARVIWAGAWCGTVAVLTRWEPLASALVASFMLALLARLDPLALSKRLLAPNLIFLLLGVGMALTFGGPQLFRVGPVGISREGTELGLKILVKGNAILLAFTALLATMPVAHLGYALQGLRIPDKLVGLLLFAYRYVFVLEEEYHRLLRAIKARGFRPRTNLHTYRTLAYLVGMLFFRAAERAERVYRAMRCRAFAGRFHCLRTFTMTSREWMGTGLLAGALLLLGLMEWCPTGAF